MSLRKASVLEMATAAYELDASVRRGLLKKVDGRWTVRGDDLDAWLEEFDGQEVVLIAASLSDERPLDTRTCRTCGREFVGLECPHCREARIRLRGR
jgi:hypothetical protein